MPTKENILAELARARNFTEMSGKLEKLEKIPARKRKQEEKEEILALKEKIKKEMGNDKDMEKGALSWFLSKYGKYMPKIMTSKHEKAHYENNLWVLPNEEFLRWDSEECAYAFMDKEAGRKVLENFTRSMEKVIAESQIRLAETIKVLENL